MKSSDDKMEIHGHRGFRGLYPENTILGFLKAAELGVDVLEMDICISADRKVVVSHEPYMNPEICITPKGHPVEPVSALKYNLYKMNYKEIRKFDCGTKYLSSYPLQKKIRSVKPLLFDVLETIEKRFNRLKYNIEIKASPALDRLFTPEPAEYSKLVLETIKPFNLEERVNLQSFDLRILEEVHKQSPETLIALLVDEKESISEKLDLLSFRPQIISPHFGSLDKNTVSDLKREGYKIIPWTVNSLDDLRLMIDLKVDAIITDYPDRLMALLVDAVN